MRLVHSFSSYYCDNENLFRYMTYFILSCIYAKRSGFDIVVYCDNRSKEYLQLAPYDEIITTLEGVEPPANSKIYAWPKFFAMKNESLGSIHIDGDVLLKDKCLIDLLNFDSYDCIVQCLEDNYTYGNDSRYIWNMSKDALSDIDYPYWAKRQCDFMYNCGVIGINNELLKHTYFDTYEAMIKAYNEHGNQNTLGIPDIIIEQQFLKDLTDHYGYSVKTLLPKFDRFNDLNEYCNSIHYQHVIGEGKQIHLNKALILIKRFDENIYNELIKLRNKY